MSVEPTRDELLGINQRLATRLANYRQGMEEQLGPVFAAFGAIAAIVEDGWQPDPVVEGFEWEIDAARVRAIRAVLKGVDLS